MGLSPKVTYLAAAEYLATERKAEFKSEYYRGEMFAMSGGTERHSAIGTNFLIEVGSQLKGSSCRAYNSDMRVKTGSGLYTYPDVCVACGPRQFEDDESDTLLNPVLVVEVLSKSTEAYDRGTKFDHYRTIKSLSEVVLISQHTPTVQTFLRNADGSWKLQPISGIDQKVKLESIGIELSMADIYADVQFDPENADLTNG